MHRQALTQLSLGLSILGTIALVSCGQKPEETAAPPPPPPASKEAAAPPVSAEAQKLGAKPKDGTTCPGDKPIKGMTSQKRGSYFVTSKNPDYATMKPALCFKDAATAQKAGFKALQ